MSVGLSACVCLCVCVFVSVCLCGSVCVLNTKSLYRRLAMTLDHCPELEYWFVVEKLGVIKAMLLYGYRFKHSVLGGACWLEVREGLKVID